MYMWIHTHIYTDAYTYFVLLLVNKGFKLSILKHAEAVLMY